MTLQKVNLKDPKNLKDLTDFATEPVPVSAYVGSSKNLEDLKEMPALQSSLWKGVSLGYVGLNKCPPMLGARRT